MNHQFGNDPPKKEKKQVIFECFNIHLVCCHTHAIDLWSVESKDYNSQKVKENE